MNMAPTLFTSCNTLPPEGALRLRPGKAGSAAPACECGSGTARGRTPMLFTSCNTVPSEGAELRLGRPGTSFAAPEIAS